MMTKAIFPDAFDFGIPTAALIGTFSRGLDKCGLEKRAALFDDEIAGIKVRPNHSCVHAITTGALETYGANNNGDGYNWEARLHVAPCPENKLHKSAALDGGLKKFHNLTFEKLGAVYRNHQNVHTGTKPSGYIIKAALNDEMKRGELLIGLDNDKWDKELHKLANEEPIFFSIAADVPYDLCSYCLHKSAERKEYCTHLKHDLLSITSDGHQIYAINDQSHLHDLSGVLRPADKIAFGLRKVASSTVLGGAELAELLGMTTPVQVLDKVLGKKASDRRELLAKLAAIEKEIEAETCATPIGPSLMAFSPEEGFGKADQSTCDMLHKADSGSLFGALREAKIILPVDLFLRILLGDGFKDVSSLVPEVQEALPGVFDRVLESPGLPEFLSDGSYEPVPCADRVVKDVVGRLSRSHSLEDGPVQARIIRVSLRPDSGVALRKKASSVTPAADYLSREYARYVVSFASGLPTHQLNLTVAQMHANVASV